MSVQTQSPSYLEQPLASEHSLLLPEGIWERQQPYNSKGPFSHENSFDQLILQLGRKIHHQQKRQMLNLEILQDAPAEGLEAVYVIEDRGRVASFIDANHLRPILIEAREPLNEAFGEATIKTLTLTRDDEGFDTLYCLVIMPGEMQEARRALRSFDQRWWLVRSAHATGILNFDFILV